MSANHPIHMPTLASGLLLARVIGVRSHEITMKKNEGTTPATIRLGQARSISAEKIESISKERESYFSGGDPEYAWSLRCGGL